MKVPSVLNVGVCVYILTHTCIDHDVRPMGVLSSGGGEERVVLRRRRRQYDLKRGQHYHVLSFWSSS